MYTYTYNQHGYSIFKDGIFIEGAGTDRTKKQHYKTAQKNIAMYKKLAQIAIAKLKANH